MEIKNNWKQDVQRRYLELKNLGKSFFPYVVFKDILAIVLVFAGLVTLSLYAGIHLETLADPTDTTYNPRPEWYFLFLFELLKYFPGSLEIVAVVVIPLVIIGFLISLPFIDKGPKRHPLDRPFITGLGLIGIVGAIYLGIQGYRSPLTNSVVEKDYQILEGQRIYGELRCQSCHSIGGRGGIVAPPLDTVGSRRNREWLTNHFRNPQDLSPGSVMPNFGLLDKEIEALVIYMGSLGGGSFTTEAPVIFQEHCSSCHKLGNTGEEIGPDLSQVGQYREQGWLLKYIENPEKIDPNASMPAFGDILTPTQIEDLSRYLAAQRGIASKKSQK